MQEAIVRCCIEKSSCCEVLEVLKQERDNVSCFELHVTILLPLSSGTPASEYDAVIVGGGHNGLVAASYLARCGVKTAVLERRHVLGEK